MKKLALLIVLFSISVMSFAQEGLTLGGHFSYNSTWLLNKQVFDEGAEMDVAVSYGNYYGIIAGYYFSKNLGVELNFNVNKLVQKYEGKIDYLFSTLYPDPNSYTAATVIRTTDIPILLKFGSNSYFELGPLVQLVNKATYTRTFNETNSLKPGWYNGTSYGFSNVSSIGVKSDFNSLGFGVVMGFGANFNLIEDVLKLNFGLRFNYILSDLGGVNALGLNKDSNYVLTDEKINFYSHPLYGGLKLGLVYYFD
jgi:hypothetical protein